MNINEFLRKQREQMGISIKDFAFSIGLSTNEYYDLEKYPDEFVTALKLDDAKKICKALNSNILDLLNISCVFCNANDFSEQYSMPINNIIKSRRSFIGMSKEELGERLGFYKEAIDGLESDKDYLGRFPIDTILALAKEIDVPPQILFGVNCKKCGH